MAAPEHKKEEITKESFMKMSDEGKWQMFQVRGTLIDLLTGKCQQMESAFFKMGKGGKKKVNAYFGGPYGYSQSSESKIYTCIEPARIVTFELIKHVDVKIEYGIRGKSIQNELYDKGWSQKKWPESKHNDADTPEVTKDPKRMLESERSRAIDISPYFSHLHPKVDWRDKEQSRAKFYVLAGTIMQVIRDLKKAGKLPADQYVRWGGDWDSDGSMRDQTFHDLGHWEFAQ